MTVAQVKSIEVLKIWWTWVGSPTPIICGDGAVIVPVGALKDDPQMWIGVEPDGRTNS